MAHKKGGGSHFQERPRLKPQRRGVKVYAGAPVALGTSWSRRSAPRSHAGHNVGTGRTSRSSRSVDGVVEYEWKYDHQEAGVGLPGFLSVPRREGVLPSHPVPPLRSTRFRATQAR